MFTMLTEIVLNNKSIGVDTCMYGSLMKVRYIPIFLLLILSFKLLSITQIGPDAWEIPSDIIDVSITIHNQMSLLFGIELLLIVLDIFYKVRIKLKPLIV